MERREVLTGADVTAALLIPSALTRAKILSAPAIEPLVEALTASIVVQRGYATLIIRVPDPKDIHDYVPGPGEYMWRRSDGTTVDLVLAMQQSDPALPEQTWRSMVGNRVNTITDRIHQALAWVRDTGAFHGS